MFSPAVFFVRNFVFIKMPGYIKLITYRLTQDIIMAQKSLRNLCPAVFNVLVLLFLTLLPMSGNAALPLVKAEFSPQWHVFVSEALTSEDAAKVTYDDLELKLADGETVKAEIYPAKDNFIDLGKYFASAPQAQRRALLVGSFTAERSGPVLLGAGGDWWFDCLVNQVSVGNTLQNGNGVKPVSALDHLFVVNAVKGNNTVAVWLLSGSAGWTFAIDGQDDPKLLRRVKPLALADDAPELLHGPWVAEYPSMVKFCYISAGNVASAVDYRTKGTDGWSRVYELAGGQMRRDRDWHCQELTGLQPDTVYEVRIVFFGPERAEEVIDPKVYTFRTAKALGGAVNFLALGDTQLPREEKRRVLTLFQDKIGLNQMDFMVLIGDLDNGYDNAYQVCFDGFLDELAKAPRLIPFYFARGNHEYRGRETNLLYELFAGVTGQSYYAFQQGDALFIVLDSGEDKAPSASAPYTLWNREDIHLQAQKRWFEQLLSSPLYRDAKFRIVLSHGSIYANGSSYMVNHYRQLIGDAFDKVTPESRIHLWIAGHTHCYTRTRPGTDEYLAFAPVSGMTGGKNFPYTILVEDGPGAAGVNTSGAAVRIDNDLITVKSLTPEGRLLDAFSIDVNGKVTDLARDPEVRQFSGADTQK